MDSENKIILVTGSTGKQGGAVLSHLLSEGWKVRALTRDPEKPKAKELAELGAEVCGGDLNNIDSSNPCFKDLYGIFSVQDVREAGVEGEIRQGIRLADIAKEIGIQHFIYTSVGSANKNTGIPFFESKRRIEEHINRLEIPASIVRPVWFMDNFSSDQFLPEILEGRLKMALNPGKPLQMVAVNDIGGFVTMMFNNPREFIGQAFDLAGDELTMPQVARIITQMLGHYVEFIQLPIEDVRKQNEAFAKMFEWFNNVGYSAKIEEIRQIYPGLMDFGTWLHEAGWEKMLQEAAVAGRR